LEALPDTAPETGPDPPQKRLDPISGHVQQESHLHSGLVLRIAQVQGTPVLLRELLQALPERLDVIEAIAVPKELALPDRLGPFHGFTVHPHAARSLAVAALQKEVPGDVSQPGPLPRPIQHVRWQ